jgi:hypothetical protein
MTDYEVRYDFQNIRFTDPADFGGKDTLFTIDDLDLSEDEKYELIGFMANHRNSGKTDDFLYDYEYWEGDVISCSAMAYDDDELKAMTEGALFTSMGATYKDRFILWNELPGFIKDKIKDYWGAKADMLYEWACEVEDVSDDDDFDYDIDDDFDIENKTAGNETLSAYVGKPLTKDVLEKITDDMENDLIDYDDYGGYEDDPIHDGYLEIFASYGIEFNFYKNGEKVYDGKDVTTWFTGGDYPTIPDSCKGQIITDCQIDWNNQEWDGNIEGLEGEPGEWMTRYYVFTVNIYVS